MRTPVDERALLMQLHEGRNTEQVTRLLQLEGRRCNAEEEENYTRRSQQRQPAMSAFHRISDPCAFAGGPPPMNYGDGPLYIDESQAPFFDGPPAYLDGPATHIYAPDIPVYSDAAPLSGYSNFAYEVASPGVHSPSIYPSTAATGGGWHPADSPPYTDRHHSPGHHPHTAVPVPGHRHLHPGMLDEWIASMHQPNYTPNYNSLAHPYLHQLHHCLAEPGFIRKRNERERMRVRNVNDGYARLRDHLPVTPSEKRLSKVETLRGAINYIKFLSKLLERDNSNKANTSSECTEVDENNNSTVTSKASCDVILNSCELANTSSDG